MPSETAYHERAEGKHGRFISRTNAQLSGAYSTQTVSYEARVTYDGAIDFRF